MNLIESTGDLQFGGFLKYPKISFEENKFTFITGPSGCGKSTYLRLLNRTAVPNSGKIYFKGKPIEEYDVLSFRRNMLLAPQETYLIDAPIRENFKFYYNAREEEVPDDDVISGFLKICSTDFTPDSICTSMSGGERQRVFLAIFLSLAKDVILLDEPTSALDENTSVKLLEGVGNYCREKGITAICVCHSKQLTERFADEIIKLEVQKDA